MKHIAILGSTGSIGTQTLKVIEEHAGDFKVTALSCGHNIERIHQQILSHEPELVSVGAEEDAAKLRDWLSTDLAAGKIEKMPRVVFGIKGLIEVAEEPASDLLVTAIVGMLGIRPTIAAIKARKDIALANKETLVCAGHIIMPLAEEMGVSILPVDSEHSAIFQSLQGNAMNRIKKILLTCSGGPFRGRSAEELKDVRPEDALAHPNWSMGAKITVDSASLVNKSLEVMEAKWLFGVELDRIQVLVHPQSILHSAVEYEDGAVIAQMGLPDMKLPIQYALYYPHRYSMGEHVPSLDLFAAEDLTFEEPDTKTFRGLALACDAMKRGGNMPTILNAANEKAVALFLAGKIPFLTIYDIIERAMAEVDFIDNPDLEEILATEQACYENIRQNFGE